jgi:hypothetical protein
LRGRVNGAHVGVLIEGIADAQLIDATDETTQDVVRDGLLDQES